MKLIATRQAPSLTCPHLGLASDPFNHKPGASDEHRCYAEMGRERIDLGHQRRFCLASAHTSCPFLMVSPLAPKGGRLMQQARAGWRNVSPVRPALSAVQLGLVVELAAAAARAAVPLARRGFALAMRYARLVVAVVLQAWQTVRPQRVPATVLTHEVATADEMVYAEPVAAPVTAEPIAVAEPVYAPMTAMAHSASVAHDPWADTRPVEVETWAPLAAEVEEPTAPVEIPPLAATAYHGDDLVALGIAAVEEGREAEGYALFKRATERHSDDVAAWFWRAKTAETLDELIDCLTRANHLEPENALIASNLEWALQRRELNREAEKAAKAAEKLAKAPAPSPLRQKRPGPLSRAARGVLDLLRIGLAIGVLGLGAGWLLSGLPAQLRDIVLQPIGLGNMPLLDASRLTSLVHIPLGGGYDAASALPYWMGFFAVFVGLGLLQRERWTRIWAPAIIVASLWLVALAG